MEEEDITKLFNTIIRMKKKKISQISLTQLLGLGDGMLCCSQMANESDTVDLAKVILQILTYRNRKSLF